MVCDLSEDDIIKNWQRLGNTINYLNNLKGKEPDLPIKLKNPEDILEVIEKWRQYDFREKSTKNVFEEVNTFFNSIGKFPVSITPLNHPFNLWRIREWKNELFKEEDQFWEPKPIFSNGPQRCNIAKEPMLYTSVNKKTPVDECNYKPDKNIYLIKYETLDTLHLVRPYCKDFHPNYEGKEIYVRNSLLSYQIIREFLRAEFTKPVGKGTEYLYKISASFSKCLLANRENVDGILYSSIQSPHEENIAILSKARSTKLKIECIFAATIKNKTEYDVKYKGKVCSGIVHWSKTN